MTDEIYEIRYDFHEITSGRCVLIYRLYETIDLRDEIGDESCKTDDDDLVINDDYPEIDDV